MRISDWSSDVCSSDLGTAPSSPAAPLDAATAPCQDAAALPLRVPPMIETALVALTTFFATIGPLDVAALFAARSEEHTSELQSLMSTSYAVFCLTTKPSITMTRITPITSAHT